MCLRHNFLPNWGIETKPLCRLTHKLTWNPPRLPTCIFYWIFRYFKLRFLWLLDRSHSSDVLRPSVFALASLVLSSLGLIRKRLQRTLQVRQWELVVLHSQEIGCPQCLEPVAISVRLLFVRKEQGTISCVALQRTLGQKIESSLSLQNDRASIFLTRFTSSQCRSSASHVRFHHQDRGL